MKGKEYSFLKQIKSAKVTDEDKALLCCVLADGKPFSVDKSVASYLMALIHLEWRDFSEIRQQKMRG
jgi:hypothetical protein